MSSASTTPQGRPSRPGLDQSRWRLCAASVLAVSAVLLFARLGYRAIWSMEVRWAEIAREMVLTHNYFWPTIGGKLYYDKPLGSYWLVVVASWFTGGVTELAARLPSALAGLLAVALLMVLACRLYDARTSLWAGLILATSFSFVFYARVSSADVETLTGVLAALLIFVRNEDRPRGWWLAGLWVVMALTSLSKGLVGFALPIAIMATYSCFADGWPALRDAGTTGSVRARIVWLIERNRWLFNARSVAAIAIGLAIYMTPFVISGLQQGSQVGLRMVVRENVLRFFEPFDHRGPIYLYVYVIFALAAPWSALLPAALVEMHHRRRIGMEPARTDRFALAYFWVTFIFFTLSGSRRSYYLVPILPAAALIIASLLARRMEMLAALARKLLVAGFVLVAALAVLGIVGILPPSAVLPGDAAALPPLPARGLYIVLWLAIVAVFGWAWRRLDTRRIGVALATLASLCLAYVFLVAMPSTEAYRTEKPFVLEVRTRFAGQLDNLAILGAQAPVYYLGQPPPFQYFMDRSRLRRAVRDGEVTLIILKQREISKLGYPVEVVMAEEAFPWESKSTQKGKVALVRVTGMPPDSRQGAPEPVSGD